MTDEPQQNEEATKTTEATETTETLLSGEQTLNFDEGRPEDFPEDFWDAEKNTANIGKLYEEYKRSDKIAKDLRVKLGKGEFTGKAPEDVSEYTLEIDEAHKEYFPDDDPILQQTREAAKEAGLPIEAYQKFMSNVLPKIAELVQPEPEKSPEEIEAERAEYRKSEFEKIGPSAPAMVRATNDFIDDVVQMGLLSPELKEAAKTMVGNADQLRVMNVFRSLAQRNKQNVNVDVPIDTKASRADLQAKLAKAASERNETEYKRISAQLVAMQG